MFFFKMNYEILKLLNLEDYFFYFLGIFTPKTLAILFTLIAL